MWESPVHVFTRTVAPKISEKLDGAIFEAILETNIEVDRDELIKALAYDRHQYDAGYSDGLEDAQPKWISVKDRLPPYVGKKILVVNGHGCIDILAFWKKVGSNWEWLDCNGHFKHTNDITHWMPLPKPPKEE